MFDSITCEHFYICKWKLCFFRIEGHKKHWNNVFFKFLANGTNVSKRKRWVLISNRGIIHVWSSVTFSQEMSLKTLQSHKCFKFYFNEEPTSFFNFAPENLW